MISAILATLSYGCNPGCGGVHDEEFTRYIFVNDSGHTIGIQAASSPYDELHDAVLEPGSRIGGKMENWGPYFAIRCLGDSYNISFDNEITVTRISRERWSPHDFNLYNPENYAIETIMLECGHEGGKTMTYTFTDADYEYALGFGDRQPTNPDAPGEALRQ